MNQPNISPEQAKKLLDKALMKNPNIPDLAQAKKEVPYVKFPFLSLEKDIVVVEDKKVFTVTQDELQKAPVGKVWGIGEFTAEHINSGELAVQVVKVMKDLLLASHGKPAVDKKSKPIIEMCLYQLRIKEEKITKKEGD